MIRSLALALLALGLASGALAQPAKGGGLRAHGFSEAELAAITPTSPNPFLAFLAAGVEPDVEYWTAKTAIEGARRARSRAARGFRSAPSATYRERERAVFNRNDGAAEPIPPEAFGDAADEPIVRIAGVFETRAPAQAVRQTVTTEDYATGALAPWSIRLGADNEEASTVATARIGDGSFGATSGDVDVYDLVVPTAGTYASIEVRTPASDLDPVMALYGPDGQFLLVADDVGDVRDPSAGFFFEAPGTYRLYVWGWTSGVRAPGLRLMADASTGYGVGSTGAYELLVESTTPDTDAYSVELKAGDVLAVATAYPTEDVAIFGPDGKLLMRSRDDISGLYPEDGPLLSPAELGAYYGGVSVAAVATRPGTYTIEARGQGEYAMVIQGARPGHERPGARGVETIFVDFDGGTYYPSRDIEGTADTTYLSPLRDFLPRWGLTAADESAVVDAFMSTLRRVLRDDLRQDVPGMAGLDIVLLNSRDHADPGPGVNRLVVAGTAEQIGAEGFIGQASSVDVGNFRQNDIAYVLLDGRSAPPDNPNSINQFTVAAPRTKAELVGHSMAAVAAHEAGHFFGLHHTENDNDVRNIQDAGPGTMWHGLDIGEDGVFGPGDGDDVRFRDDAYYRFHPFSGTLNAAAALAHSLHTAEPAASGGTASSGLAAERFSPAAIAAVIAAGGSTSGRVLARESFASDPTGAWAQDNAYGTSRVESGALRIQGLAGKTIRERGAEDFWEGGGDFAMRVDLRHAGGCDTHGAGFYFRWADQAYNLAFVDASGESWTRINRYTGSDWSALTEWERTDAARQDDWNALELVVVGSRAQLFLNGRLVQAATIPAVTGQSAVGGLLVNGCSDAPMEYLFDNYTVVALGDAGGLRAFGPTPPSTAAGGAAPEETPASGGAPRHAPEASEVGVRGMTGGHPAAQGYAFSFGATRVRLTEGEGQARLWVLEPGAEAWREAQPGEVTALLERPTGKPPAVAAETPLSGAEAEAALARLRRLASGDDGPIR